MRKNNLALFSASAASYLLFVIVGMILLSSTTSSLESIGNNLPVLQGLEISHLTLLAQFYMIVGIVGLVLNIILSLARINLLAFLCIVIDVQYIAMHLYYMQGAGNGAKILLIFFVILSIVSLVSNLTSFRTK